MMASTPGQVTEPVKTGLGSIGSLSERTDEGGTSKPLTMNWDQYCKTVYDVRDEAIDFGYILINEFAYEQIYPENYLGIYP